MGWWPKKKKKEENRFWTKFRKRDQCAECGNLERGDDPLVVVIGGFNGVCPECGSEKINKVVARWEISVVSHPMALSSFTTYYKSEIRDIK